jgi:hypothetical protein
MEFYALLVLLYGAQCLTHLPRGAVLFARPFLGRAEWGGPGWRLESLRPAARLYVGERLPWVAREGTVRWRGVEPRWRGADLAAKEPAVDLGESAIEAKGAALWVDGVRVLRSATETGTRAIEQAFQEVRDEASLRRAIEARVAEEISLPRFRAARSRVEGVTMGLRRVLDLYAALLFVALPLAMFSWGVESALWRLAVVLLALHGIGVMVFSWAHRRCFPGRTGELVQALVEVLLYPPALLRSLQKLRSEAIGRHHPAVLALDLLPEDAAREFLRRELVRVEQGLGEGTGRWLGEVELDALEKLAAESGTSRAELLAPPLQRDLQAVSYCPSCLAEYRRPDGYCSDCRISLAAYPASVAPH